MKDMHLLDWPRDELLTAITEFVLLTVQMQNLTAQSRARLVATTSASQYMKSNKKRGRKSITPKPQNPLSVIQYEFEGSICHF